MKITAVKTHLLRHPLARPSGPSVSYSRERSLVVVEIQTDAGVSGWGDTDPIPGVRAIIEERHAPLLLGKDPLAHRSLWRELWGPNFGNGFSQGGVDIALDDLRGKALGLPVAELYGGRLRERVQAYASPLGYVAGEDAEDTYARWATVVAEKGFRGLKLRIGGQAMKDDLRAIRAAIRAAGPEMKIMADGNGAYSLKGAVRMGRELEQLGLYWFEEPIPESTPDYAGYEVLRSQLDIPIAAGEQLTARGMFKEVICRRAMDIIQPDPSAVGGIGEALFIAELARLWGISCMPHCFGGPFSQAAVAHLVSLLPESSWSRYPESPLLETDTAENRFLAELPLAPMKFESGEFIVPTGPGLGVEVDRASLLRLAQ